jgi:hypothetical protein
LRNIYFILWSLDGCFLKKLAIDKATFIAREVRGASAVMDEEAVFVRRRRLSSERSQQFAISRPGSTPKALEDILETKTRWDLSKG